MEAWRLGMHIPGHRHTVKGEVERPQIVTGKTLHSITVTVLTVTGSYSVIQQVLCLWRIVPVDHFDRNEVKILKDFIRTSLAQ